MIPGVDHPILLITEEGREEEVVTRLARVGYDYAIGYLKGGFDAWKKSGKEVDTITSIDADMFAEKLKKHLRKNFKLEGDNYPLSLSRAEVLIGGKRQ